MKRGEEKVWFRNRAVRSIVPMSHSGQGIVHEPDIRKPGIAAFNLTFRTDAEVIELPR